MSTKSTKLETIVDRLGDTLNTYLSKCHNYQEVHKALEKGESISPKQIDKLLAICVRDMEKDVQYIASALTVISLILKLKLEGYSPVPDLLPSALAITHTMKSISQIRSLDALPVLCFETLLFFPDDILVALATSHKAAVIQIIDIYTQTPVDVEKKPPSIKNIDVLLFKFLGKLLKILPADSKEEFVKEGLWLWFSKVIPNTIAVTKIAKEDFTEHIETLELLTDALVPINYEKNHNWRVILEGLSNSQKYPAIMMKLLMAEKDVWCRLWIIFIKLLKDQITKATVSSRSPINTLLPIVETAFKLRPEIRCQAFQCWNVLIDNFSTEINESQVNKRMKLLIVPLKSFNAKVEETSLAKLKTWWHLMRQFHSKMDNFIELVLIPFLHFCFGKIQANGIPIATPVEYNSNVKRECLQALVEIAGHVDCEGCVTLPKMNSKLFNVQTLVEYWKDWIHSIRTSINIAVEVSGCTEVPKQQVSCVWKAFLTTIDELPGNSLKKDLILELLLIFPQLQKEFARNEKAADLVINVLITSFFEKEGKLKNILKLKCEGKGPIHTVVSALVHPSMDNFYKSNDARELVDKMKPVANFILEDSARSNEILEWLFDELPAKDTTLLMWTALVECICESKHEICPTILRNLLIWPLSAISIYSTDKSTVAWYSWFTLYNLVHTKYKDTAVDVSIFETLSEQNNVMNSSSNLLLCAALALIKYKLITENNVVCESELLVNILRKVDDYQSIEKSFPVLVDTLVLMLNKIADNFNSPLALNTLQAVKIVLNLLDQALKINDGRSDIQVFIKNLLKCLQVEGYSVDLIVLVVEELIARLPHVNKDSSEQNSIMSILKACISSNKDVDCEISTKIKPTIDGFGNNKSDKKIDSTETNKVQRDDVKNNFTTPTITGLSKKSNKKEASIVNTVVENGEEFVVVKSNWKFNPKKLTENQKEKFKRKREDIPALYQDLSQSQDEFKLTAWKTDSQDTTTSSNSKSTSKASKQDVSIILKNIPSSDVVPSIMKNILSDNIANEKTSSNTEHTTTSEQQTLAVKGTKSPRMALKDRVFMNVRNLMEKSNLHNDDRLISIDLKKSITENVPKTPVTKTKTTKNVISSAPPKITCERPSRLIKMPKKFNDSEMLVIKKTRRSQNDSQSQPLTEDFGKSLKDKHIKMNKEDKIFGPEDVNSTEDHLIINNEKQVNNGNDKAQNCDNETIFPQEDTVKKQNNNTNREMLLAIDAPDTMITKMNTGVEDHSLSTSEKSTRASKKCNEIEVCESIVNKKPRSEKDSNRRRHCGNQTPILKSDVSHLNNSKPNIETVGLKNNSQPPNVELNNPLQEKQSVVIMSTVENSSEAEGNTSIANSDNQKKSFDNLSETSDPIHDVSKPQEENKIQNNDTNREDTALPIQKSDTKMNNITKFAEKMLLGEEKGTRISDEITTPKAGNNKTVISDTSTPKRVSEEINKQKSAKKKRSRIEKQLLIDTVEGHPLLQARSEKRVTRKNLSPVGSLKRKSLVEKLNKAKLELKSADKVDKKNKEKRKSCDDSSSSSSSSTKSRTVSESQENLSNCLEDLPQSEDVIESSQDSTMTAISMKSAKHGLKKVPIVILQDSIAEIVKNKQITDTQLLLDDFNSEIISLSDTMPMDQENKEDIELPKNKTMEETSEINLTENMDTEPMETESSSDVIGITEPETVVVINTDDSFADLATQLTAEADTQPINTVKLVETIQITGEKCSQETPSDNLKKDKTTIDISVVVNSESSGTCSPLKNDAQRKNDFLNDTIEISPIKAMSPLREKKSPSPETSSDYVVIKLTSPVQSNGEPFDKCDSPEVFTEDKVSPGKRDMSPPRTEIIVSNTSPSSLLSLKKNRNSVRPTGRAAQLLGLCASDKLQITINSERPAETEEIKKNSQMTTPVRRNLKILYNSLAENNVNTDKNEDSENFLKFKRSLPTEDCSPSGPILKRKLAEIADEVTISPASKRKRVSFHDPPVSTTIAVQKYIEPGGLRSPQSSALKRLEKQIRAHTTMKSPKRLDNVFKLNTALTKTVASFTEEPTIAVVDDTEVSSMEQTPSVEIVKTSELNDTDPICSDLLDCDDPIANIAGELSSAAMKELFIMVLKGKVETIADLAKMTELEVNRLSIKAPKVKVAKKVLADYASKRIKTQDNQSVKIAEPNMNKPITILPEIQRTSVEMQTEEVVAIDKEMQTVRIQVALGHTQTDTVPTAHSSVQTEESGNKSTQAIVTSCLSERFDFIEELREQLDESSIKQIAKNMSFEASADLLTTKITASNSTDILNRVLDKQSALNPSNEDSGSNRLLFLQNYMCKSFDSKDLILFCSQLLHKIHDKAV